jgi:hypothetical protein
MDFARLAPSLRAKPSPAPARGQRHAKRHAICQVGIGGNCRKSIPAIPQFRQLMYLFEIIGKVQITTTNTGNL